MLSIFNFIIKWTHKLPNFPNLHISIISLTLIAKSNYGSTFNRCLNWEGTNNRTTYQNHSLEFVCPLPCFSASVVSFLCLFRPDTHDDDDGQPEDVCQGGPPVPGLEGQHRRPSRDHCRLVKLWGQADHLQNPQSFIFVESGGAQCQLCWTNHFSFLVL